MERISLTDLLNNSSTVFLCATSRLAQFIRHAQAKSMIQTGLVQWQTVQAHTVDQWLSSLHDEVALQGFGQSDVLNAVVLDGPQERLLWERVIRHDLGDKARYFFDIASLAKTATEAHELSVIWNVQPQSDVMTEESRRFQTWQQRFTNECHQNGWIDIHRLHKALVNEIPQLKSVLHPTQRVAFAGFTRYNPVEQQLQAKLAELGIEVIEVDVGQDHDDVTLLSVSYPDSQAEVLAAALWAQQRLTSQADAKLAIVVPDLAGSRHLLQDTLEDVLCPELISPAQAETQRPFNISLGEALIKFPIVTTALSVLDLLANPQRVTQSAFGQMLLSPYWSAAETEGQDRSFIEAQMRKRVAPVAPLKSFHNDIKRQVTAKPSHVKTPQLLHHLACLLGSPSTLSSPLLPSAWAKQMPGLLRHCGWLFERKLSSHEYQAKEALMDVIHQMGRLDDFVSTIAFPEAVALLRRLCQDRTFQPQTEGQPRLQVLGLLETSGIQFDGIWVMGMVDTAWPPQARPNALLPSELQRQAQSPNASANVQLEFARKFREMLLRASPEITFSWPRTSGASELNPSPLIPATEKDKHLPCPASGHWTVEAVKHSSTHLAAPVEDHMAPEVETGQRVRGGTWLLKAQAICPAWAYFQYRLGASKLEEPVEGLDARKRGTLLHDALEYFWKQVRTSANLKAMSGEDRQDLVQQAVHHVLTKYDADDINEPLKPRFKQLEFERLTRLLMGWLDVELQREQPFEVIANEKKVELDIEGIQARMFIDRIDRLDDGSLLVIDYKTGATIDTKNWASDRLTEPQLPIYASIGAPKDATVQGVVFAKVLMKDPTWAGLAAEERILPKVTGFASRSGRKLYPEEQFPDWNSVLTHWSARIRAVAGEVRAGEAGVRFADEKALTYCDVRPLLRLSERREQLEQALRAAETVSQEASA